MAETEKNKQDIKESKKSIQKELVQGLESRVQKNHLG